MANPTHTRRPEPRSSVLRRAPHERTARPSRRQSERGAAMLVTMLVVLAATSTGIFAFYSSGYELRTAGYARTAAQTHYVTEGSINAAIGEFDSLEGAIVRAAQRPNSFPTPIVPDPGITDIPAARRSRTWGYRFLSTDFTTPVIDTTDDGDGSSLGPGTSDGSVANTRVPAFTVDINDIMLTQQPVPGASASGIGIASTYVNVTYTGRGQIGPNASWTSTHRSIEAARSHTVAGPFPGLR